MEIDFEGIIEKGEAGIVKEDVIEKKEDGSENEESRNQGMFSKFKKMLATLQISISFHEIFELMPKFAKIMKALLKGTKEKVVKEHILHALCDLGSSINVIPLKKVKELKVGEITPSNMTLTLADSSVTQPIGILRDVLVHVNILVFPVDFAVLDTKGDSGGFVILG
ncbi:uncharacterized protein LOC127123773 [Lathyrus oleraceus]|uniref:uncharacterized protein LOC127123773 n=1 Tax=Pisum sativum TaxID=3888 RepID=UPI0021D280B0|nr:uncharacterized protein LOC127123773 [Pisum sativum]